MAQIYQSDLASLGIHAQVHQLDTADFVSRFHKASFGGLWLSNAGLMNLSPATFLTSSAAVRIPNGSNYSSERYAALVSSIKVATDTSAQKALLGELTQLMLDDCFVAPIAEGSGLPNGPDLARATVRNIAWNPFGVFDYHDVWLDV
jgi:ABC-type transport system substrate-binding protein